MTTTSNRIPRPPIVVVMGHIDHGKSTLLDYIRKSNTVESEAGGITQHLSAYVVEHEPEGGEKKRITFLDTPGHEAFQKMRLRGADVADVAILVVSAEDGVKPQTLEALASIKAARIPYVVAINKIDKPAADVPRTQASLIEHEIYIEGMGGDIPFVPISAVTGEGVNDLLDIVLLTAELAELSGDPAAAAAGTVIEANLDQRRGTSATLLVTDGTLKSGQYVVSGTTYAPVRIMEDWSGASIKEARLSEPVRIVGFSDIPAIGAAFRTVKNKKEAEAAAAEAQAAPSAAPRFDASLPTIPVLIKADTLGTIDAIEHEIAKLENERVHVRIIDARVGPITASDVQNISATEHAIIIGFHVSTERGALELAERLGVAIQTFSIIYELAEWLGGAISERTPSVEVEEQLGRAKILKLFSAQKHTHVLGGRVEEGALSVGNQVRIMRRDIEIGRGKITNLQQQKSDVSSVSNGEFGMQIESRSDIAAGDHIEAFTIVTT